MHKHVTYINESTYVCPYMYICVLLCWLTYTAYLLCTCVYVAIFIHVKVCSLLLVDVYAWIVCIYPVLHMSRPYLYEDIINDFIFVTYG